MNHFFVTLLQQTYPLVDRITIIKKKCVTSCMKVPVVGEGSGVRMQTGRHF